MDPLLKKEAHTEGRREVEEEMENREGAVCPEDFGFEEYIRSLEARIRELEGVLANIDIEERDGISAYEDMEVRELCERVGYGAVMDSAARQWRKKDPIGAFTVGPCVYVVKDALKGESK